MRIAIDYSAAVNQRAGVGRLVRNQVLALADVDHTNEYRLVFARPNTRQPAAAVPEGAQLQPSRDTVCASAG